MCVHVFSHVFPIFSPYFPRYVAGNLEVGARVQATRPISYDRLQPVVPGAVGTVLGPALEEPLQRIVVRWDGARPVEREAQADDVRLMMLGFWIPWMGINSG